MLLPSPKELREDAQEYLDDEGHKITCDALRQCSLMWEIEIPDKNSPPDWQDCNCVVHVTVTGPKVACDELNENLFPVWMALNTALPFSVLATIKISDEDRVFWDNQATGTKPLKTWNNLRFRSESEVRIARALDERGVLFLPNCRARLGSLENRVNREADFLVCYNGRWGVLEVDGEPYHPPSRTVEDHSRDRLFMEHGICVVQHYDAAECFENPEDVVQGFLRILSQTK